jgi:ribulose-phosphate 3-epimerase
MRRRLSWLAWRHRYLGMFAIIGFFSIAIEVGIVLGLRSLTGHFSLGTSLIGFAIGMFFAFYGNYRFNFRVERRKFWRTLLLFALISCCSYGLNLSAKGQLDWLGWDYYPSARFLTSGALFAVAYYLHRHFTFRHAAKDLGLAVYAAQGTDVEAMFERIGEHCDHIHIDLVDETFKADAAPVEIPVIQRARESWPWHPFVLHIMSRRPAAWAKACLPLVDVVLIHVDVEDDPWSIMAGCRVAGKGFGIVSHHTVTLDRLLPLLPHCDYVLVLGIEKPGYSGQTMMPEALIMAETLAHLGMRHGFKLIFDGGVTVENVQRVPADMIVSSSSVLRSEDPIAAALALMTGVTHERPR